MTSRSTAKYKYDVFVSHNKRDKPWVRRFVDQLRAAGKQVFFDADTVEPGEGTIRAVERGLSRSRHVVVVITPQSMASKWVNFESTATAHEDLSGARRRLIPLLLEATKKKLPWFIKGRNIVDLSQPDRAAEEYQRFLRSLDIPEDVAKTMEFVSPDELVRHTGQVSQLPAGHRYVKLRTRDLMADYLKDRLKDDQHFKEIAVMFGEAWERYDITFNWLVRRCFLIAQKVNLNLTEDVIYDLIFDARKHAYDTKYGNRTEEDDERHLNFVAWENELRTILHALGHKDFKSCPTVNVGIGNGTECPSFYKEIQDFYAVDVSQRVLEAAKTKIDNDKLITCLGDAAKLPPAIPSQSRKLYLSLRTYQSTLFDLEDSVFEAYRVLENGGSAVISVSNAHRDGSSVIQGILVPGVAKKSDSRDVDFDLPYRIADRIRTTLTRLSFVDIGIHTGLYEVYVYGKKHH